MRDAFLLTAARLPTGKFLGSLKEFSATQLGAVAIREAVARAGIDPASVDECIMGNVLSAGLGQNPARQAAPHGGLSQDVDVTAFVPAGEAAPVRELLGRYAYESPRFKVEFADPTARPDLVEKLGVTPEKLGKGLVRVAIGKDAVELNELDEAKITNALVKLTRQSAKKVYFLEGHGERPLKGETGDGKEGFSRAAQALRNENYQVESLLLAQKGDVPEDANVVILAGPNRALPEEEHAALERYLAVLHRCRWEFCSDLLAAAGFATREGVQSRASCVSAQSGRVQRERQVSGSRIQLRHLSRSRGRRDRCGEERRDRIQSRGECFAEIQKARDTRSGGEESAGNG